MNNTEIFAQGVKLGLKVAIWVGGVLTAINIFLFGIHWYYIKKSYESPTNEVTAQLTKELTDYVIANNRSTDARFAAVDKEIAVNTQSINDNLSFINYKIDANDRALREYVDCKTIPLEKKIGINQICPTPLSACAPLAVKGQFINTEDSNQTNTVVGNVKSK